MVRRSPQKINVKTSSGRMPSHIQMRVTYRLADLIAWTEADPGEHRAIAAEIRRGNSGLGRQYPSAVWVGRHLLIEGVEFLRAARTVWRDAHSGGGR